MVYVSMEDVVAMMGGKESTARNVLFVVPARNLKNARVSLLILSFWLAVIITL